MSIELATKDPLQSAAAAPAAAEAREPAHQAVYFDGRTNRKRSVKLSFAGGVDIIEQDTIVDVWSFGDVRRVDGPPGQGRGAAHRGAMDRVEEHLQIGGLRYLRQRRCHPSPRGEGGERSEPGGEKPPHTVILRAASCPHPRASRGPSPRGEG